MRAGRGAVVYNVTCAEPDLGARRLLALALARMSFLKPRERCQILRRCRLAEFADYSLVQLALLLRRRLGAAAAAGAAGRVAGAGKDGPGSLDRWPTGMHFSVGAGISTGPAGNPRSARRAVLARCATIAGLGGGGCGGGYATTHRSWALCGIQVRSGSGTEGSAHAVGPCARSRPGGASRQPGRLAGEMAAPPLPCSAAGSTAYIPTAVARWRGKCCAVARW